MSPSDFIRILIVDDHAVVRKGLAMVLRLEHGLEVIGEAQNGREGLEAVERLQPDLVLLDLVMPEMDGHQMALALRAKHPHIKILMLTGTQLDDRALDLLAAGIEGYVFKNIEPAELVAAIRAVMRGEAYLHPDVMRRVAERLRTQSARMGSKAGEEVPPSLALTPRELEVLEWMATPLTYKQIAAHLNVSEETIRSHAKHILEKLAQPNRTQAVLTAIRMGWVNLPNR